MRKLWNFWKKCFFAFFMFYKAYLTLFHRAEFIFLISTHFNLFWNAIALFRLIFKILTYILLPKVSSCNFRRTSRRIPRHVCSRFLSVLECLLPCHKFKNIHQFLLQLLLIIESCALIGWEHLSYNLRTLYKKLQHYFYVHFTLFPAISIVFDEKNLKSYSPDI